MQGLEAYVSVVSRVALSIAEYLYGGITKDRKPVIVFWVLLCVKIVEVEYVMSLC